MGMTFTRARKSASRLRMALAGPSGSGKTYSALLIATGLADGGPIAVIDTERGSASKYADQFTFDVLELDSFHPDRYIEAIQAAATAGYAVLVIDSLSHAWNGTGGALELHDQAVKRQKTQNSYTAWADITPLQNKLVNAITGAPLHVIATMRAKTEYIQDKNERGGTTIRKVGMAPIQRDGMEYEFDVMGQIDLDHTLVIEKSRCSALSGAVIAKPGAHLAETLADWLRGDDDGASQQTASTTQPPTAARTAPRTAPRAASPTAAAPVTQAAQPAQAKQPTQAPQAAALPTSQPTAETDLPTWGALGNEAGKLGLDQQEWQRQITTLTGKTRTTDPATGQVITMASQLTDDDKRTMLTWLANRRKQFEAADAATPPLETLAYAGN